jgi:hypothetical protein
VKLAALIRRHHAPAAAPTAPTPDPPDEATLANDPPVTAATYRHLITRDDGTVDAGVWAYYLAPGVDHQFVTPHKREKAYGDQLFRWADLIGRRVWVRGTTSPFPVEAYGRTLVARGGRPVPDATRSFDELVAAAQLMLHGYDAKTPLTVLGVQITRTPVKPEHLPHIAGNSPIPNDLAHLNDVRRELVSVGERVARDGFNARPLTGPALQWLIHASRGLGCPVPPVITDRDREADQTWQNVAGFTGGVYATASEFSPTVNVRVLRDLHAFERHVVVQPVERFEDRDLDDTTLTPWLAWAVTLDEPSIGPVDYVAAGELVAGDDLIGNAEFVRRKAESQAENWAEVGERIPAAVLRGIDRASVIEDEVTNGSREVAARFRGVVLFATSGDDEGQALDRARQFRSHIAREQRIGLADAHAQYALYRAFTPGVPETASPAVIGGHVTRSPLYYLATAVPNAYATAGDTTGFPLGPVGGSTEVFVHDPHGLTSRNESGLSVFLGQQGAGKSSLVGALIDWSVAQGRRNVFTDPAGTMRRLCDLPWNRGDSYVFDLARASEGVAVPSLLIPEPRLADYPGAQYERALRDAAAARVDATIDVFREMLPHQLVMSDAGADLMAAVEDVVTEHGASYGADPWDLLDRLARHGDAGARAAKLLKVRGQGSVFFPASGRHVDDDEIRAQFEKATLTGISMEGIAVPEPGLPRQLWSRDQQRSAPLLLVASLLAMRVMYADRDPKQVTMDELGIVAAGGQGASPVLLRGGTESRKFGATVNVVGQTPSMFTALGDQVSNLVGFVAVGMMDEVTAAECLPLLGLRPESGHAQTVASLGRGEFVIRRATITNGRREVMRRRVYVDRSWWHPELLAALDTTPGGEGSYDAGVDDGLVTS